MEFEMSLQERGYDVIGVAVDYPSAVALAASKPDVALVDINLRDGPTGPRIAEQLALDVGTSVVFVTANPRQLAAPVPGALGVVTKPADQHLVAAAVDYAMCVRNGLQLPPPGGLSPFGSPTLN